jgi:hypothetical protein
VPELKVAALDAEEEELMRRLQSHYRAKAPGGAGSEGEGMAEEEDMAARCAEIATERQALLQPPETEAPQATLVSGPFPPIENCFL